MAYLAPGKLRTIISACFLVAALLGQFMTFAQAQELSQTANWPGLGTLLDLGPVLPATSASISGNPPTDDCDKSPCTSGSFSTTTAAFGDTDQTILVCMCEGAQEDINALVSGLAQIPLFIRQNVHGITSIPADSASAYTYPDSGRITMFGDVEFDVYIHEAAHAQDNGFSTSTAYTDALAMDTCVPDEYARTNTVECYAQDMVVFLYRLWKKTTPDPGTGCMENQLTALQNSGAPGLQDYIASVP